jgi:sarcosine oxidase subunit beta
MIGHETEVAVLGAGIIGAASAHALARAGRRVLLLDAAGPAAGASGASDGFVSVSTKAPGLMMELALASRSLYPQTVAALRLQTDWRPVEGLLLIEDDRDVAAMTAHAAALAGLGVDIEAIDAGRLGSLEPALSPGLAGAVLTRGEGLVSGYLMTLALVEAAAEAGAATLWGAVPLAADVAGSRLAALDTSRGRVAAETWVLAAGVGSRALGALIGLPIPVEPRRGALVVTTRGRLLSERMLVSARYLTAKTDPKAAARSEDPLVRLGHGFVMEPTATRQHVIGSTRTFSGTDRSVDTATIATILAEAARRVPAVGELQVLRAFAGLRPFVPDGRPLIGRSRLRPNVVVATGHEGDGITLAPVTARIVEHLVAGRDDGFDLGPLDPDRFAP